MGSHFAAKGAGKWGDSHMIIKASGRSALILATGLWICFAGPSQAASADDADGAAAPVAKHSSHHWKKHAQSSSSKEALKSSDSKKAGDSAAADSDNSAAVRSSQMPPSVANANAQLASDTPAGKAQAMSARANNIVQAAPDKTADMQLAAGTPIVAADQLNDVDRALHESSPPATPVALASADVPVAAANPPVAAASNESSTWDQTSLIGKIFIGFGALLTMASAARMFIA
jgi:hypothetical protein